MATRARTKPAGKEGDETQDDSFPLAEEVRTYESHLPGWGDREGQFVLIKGRKILGFFPGYDQAMEAGYDRLGNVDFLVKQISQAERIYNLDRIDL